MPRLCAAWLFISSPGLLTLALHSAGPLRDPGTQRPRDPDPSPPGTPLRAPSLHLSSSLIPSFNSTQGNSGSSAPSCPPAPDRDERTSDILRDGRRGRKKQSLLQPQLPPSPDSRQASISFSAPSSASPPPPSYANAAFLTFRPVSQRRLELRFRSSQSGFRCTNAYPKESNISGPRKRHRSTKGTVGLPEPAHQLHVRFGVLVPGVSSWNLTPATTTNLPYPSILSFHTSRLICRQRSSSTPALALTLPLPPHLSLSHSLTLSPLPRSNCVHPLISSSGL